MIKSFFIFVALVVAAILVATIIGVAATMANGNKAIPVFHVGAIWIATLIGFTVIAAVMRRPFSAGAFAIAAVYLALFNLTTI